MDDLWGLWSVRSTPSAPQYWWKWSYHRISDRGTPFPESLKIASMENGFVRMIRNAQSCVRVWFSLTHVMKDDSCPWYSSLRGTKVRLHPRTYSICQLKTKGKRDRNMCISGDMVWAVSRYEAKPVYTGKTLSDNVKTRTVQRWWEDAVSTVT